MKKHLVIAAAGTGGHVMPGIAVAKIMISRGWEVSWIGTRTGMEKRLVERHGIPFTALDFEGLRGKGIKTFLFGGVKLLSSIFQSKKYLTEVKADAVFSTGGSITKINLQCVGEWYEEAFSYSGCGYWRSRDARYCRG